MQFPLKPSLFHQSQKLDEKTSQELIKTASQEAQRLKNFITNILEMTKIESNPILIKGTWICPEEFLHQVKRSMQNTLNNFDYEIQVIEQKDHENLEINLDFLTASQVIKNVIDNAIKYSNVKKVEISYKKSNNGVLFLIRDFGPGIEKEKLEDIFNKYERLKNSDNITAGTGLGLAICKAIMNAQGGFIKARNHEEKGCVFEIWFPKYRVQKNYNSSIL